MQQIAATVQQQAHERIAGVVTRCLAAVFPDPYTFHIHFEKKRGKTEARMVFQRDGHELHPTEAAGLGVVDVAALGLRLACLVLSKPQPRKFLCLDEPMRWVSKENRPRVVELIAALAQEFGVQFLIVTHDQDFEIGKVIRLTKPKRTT